MTVPLRAALYLRVSTARQAEHDVSIPDQRKQGEAYCASRGYDLVETFVDAGASATNDRRPEFQRMIEAGISKPATFEVVVVHSFSRFFRDHFELEFYVRKLAKNCIRLLSITQEMGDDPMHVMMRQIMALFDEYQSKENAKHVLRAMKENARQGFWNGSLPPIGYRVVRIMGSKGDLLRTLAGAADATGRVPSFVLKWRRGWDSNPRWAQTHNGFRDRPDRPLRHLSALWRSSMARDVAACSLIRKGHSSPHCRITPSCAAAAWQGGPKRLPLGQRPGFGKDPPCCCAA